MAETGFKVVFRGEVATGQAPDEVARRLAERFRMAPERTRALFSGKAVVIKRDIDESTAQRLASTFEALGAICEVHGPDEAAGATASTTPTEPPPPARPATAEQAAGRATAAAGSASTSTQTETAAVVPRQEERAQAGAEVAAPFDPNQTVVPLAVPEDLSHLSLDPAESYTPPPDDTPVPEIDTGGLEVADSDEPLQQPDQTTQPPNIDTSGLSVEPPAESPIESGDSGR